AIDAARDSGARRGRSPLRWVAAIAAVLAIAALGAWNVSLQNDMSRLRDYDAAMADVLAIAKAPGAKTAVLRSDSGDPAVGLAALDGNGSFAFAVRNLAPTTGTQVYEVWAVQGERHVPLGSFRVEGSGVARLVGTVASSPAGMTLGLTREPGPDVTTPTLPMILTGPAVAPPPS
ncbi:MAG: anti-sigma factor domain-containing protein, partial [Chloroflexota bacterium]